MPQRHAPILIALLTTHDPLKPRVATNAAALLLHAAVPISASLRASCASETMGSDSGDGRMASIEAKVESLAVSVAAIAKAVEETRQGMSEMRKAMASKE